MSLTRSPNKPLLTSVDILNADAVFLVKRVRTFKTMADFNTNEVEIQTCLNAIISLREDLDNHLYTTLTYRTAKSRLKYAADFLRREVENVKKRLESEARTKLKSKAKKPLLNAQLVAKFIINEALKLQKDVPLAGDLDAHVATVDAEKEGVPIETLVALLEPDSGLEESEDIDFLEGMDGGL